MVALADALCPGIGCLNIAEAWAKEVDVEPKEIEVVRGLEEAHLNTIFRILF